MIQKKSPKKSKIKKEILDFDLLQEAESQEINENLNFSDNALEVLRRRYLKKDENRNPIESPAQLFRRVARAVALADKNYKAKKEDITKTEEIFYQMMVGKDFLPNSPTMMNAGRPLGQLSACFVLPIGDSIPEIFQAITEAALIHKSGGGTGFSFSRLRPKGSMVGTTFGVASGPVSFMRIFDSATEEIKQGGTRRGANMGILRIDHPDILEFVKVKEDLNQMRNFNISVAVTDEFMKALNNNSLFALRDPRDKKIIEEIPAKQIFDEIVHQAWLTGDPGLVFIDRINQLNPLKKISEIEATNPCLTADGLVYTNEGLIPIAALYNKTQFPQPVLLNSKFGENGEIRKVIKTGVRLVYRLETKEGYALRLTADHELLTTRGWLEAKNISKDDKIYLLNHKGGFGKNGSLEWGRILGWLVGDGTLRAACAVLSFFGEEKEELAPVFAQYLNQILPKGQNNRQYILSPIEIKGRDEVRLKSRRLARLLYQIGIKQGAKIQVPKVVFQGSEAMQKGFLQAIFTADGYAGGNRQKGISVRLTSISLPFLEDIQRLLINFGIFSRIYTNRRQGARRLLPDGKGGQNLYDCQAYHELVISKDVLTQFVSEIGFLSRPKQQKLLAELSQYTRGPYKQNFLATFKRLIPQGKEVVYDLQEKTSHSFIANGMVVHNCGEQPLPSYDSCNLGSINLANFVNNHKIDWTRLKEIIWQGVHFLDNIIDVNNYPISQIAKTTRANRRIGLGIMGFADLLLYIGVPYDSSLALQTAKKIAIFFQKQATAASMALAKKRGNFPTWKDSIYAPKQSMRNATATTVAPTGTISMIADCSSGIEPLYAVAFTKTVMDRTKLIYVHPYFEQLAKKEGWYSKELMEEIVQKGTIEDSSQIPDHIKKLFICAHQISPTQHVLMQAAFQQFIDSGVSKTINLHNNATENDVKDALILAYKHGCKGITVFRDSCRREQVLTKGAITPTELPVVEPAHVPRERPSILYGSTEKIPTGLGSVYVTVNEDNKGPFEVFATIGKSGGDASSFSEAIGRLISLCLRSGIEVAEIIDHLKGIRGPNPVWQNGELILSCPDAIGKALERYIQKKSTLKLQWEQKLTSVLPVPENMAEQKGDVLCPECGAAMKFSEGCFSCPSCGYSKCG